MRRKKKRRRSRHEPEEPEGELEAYGGELIWAVDHTPGGVPLGPTVDELRMGEMRRKPQRGWSRALSAVRSVFPPESDIERVKWIGDGLHRKAYTTRVDGEPVVILLQRDEDPEVAQATRRQAQVLHILDRLNLPFRTPRLLGLVEEALGPALIETGLAGLQLPMKPLEQGPQPWTRIGTLAAQVHSISPSDFAHVVPHHKTWRAHVDAKIAALGEPRFPLLRDAIAWCQAQHTPEAPACFLHGDLLGQNIMLGLFDDAPGLIDWAECSIGDPASDLAVVTRGGRKPFKTSEGLARLVEAYNEAGDVELSCEAVRVHEVLMQASWVTTAAARDRRAREQQLAGLLRRIDG